MSSSVEVDNIPTATLISSDGASRQIARHAEGLLRQSPYPALCHLRCSYDRGILTIEGDVPSYYMKQLAQTVVANLKVIDEIDNQVTVEGWGEPSLTMCAAEPTYVSA